MMRMHILKRCLRNCVSGKKGFTLIELLVALTISLLVAGVACALLFSGYTTYKHVAEGVDTQENVRLAISYIMQTLRQAGDSSKVQVLQTADGSDVLDVQVEVKDEYGNMYTEKRRFKLESGSLYEDIDGISNEIAYNIISFKADRDSDIITISIIGRDKNGMDYTLSSTYTLRK